METQSVAGVQLADPALAEATADGLKRVVDLLLEYSPEQHVTVDVVGECLITPDGDFPFTIDPFRKHGLLHGVDEIELTESLDADISEYETAARRARLWEQQP